MPAIDWSWSLLLGTLRRIEPGIPDDVLASVGGALAACALGVSPTAWRAREQIRSDGVLPVPPIEAYAWGVTGWLLVDLYEARPAPAPRRPC
jgi:hypothetical protein